MKGHYTDIKKQTIENNNFRKVLFTSYHSQLVLMALLPGEEIGMEVHTENDQFFRFEEGEGRVIIDNDEYSVKNGDAVIVPAGRKHNVINTSNIDPLKLYTIYSPAHHADKTVHKTKKQAEEAEKHEE